MLVKRAQGIRTRTAMVMTELVGNNLVSPVDTLMVSAWAPHEDIQVNDAHTHHTDVTISTMASQVTSLTIVYSTVYSGADQRKLQSSASLAFVRGIHRWPVNSPHKGPVTRKMFSCDDVIIIWNEANDTLFPSGADQSILLISRWPPTMPPNKMLLRKMTLWKISRFSSLASILFDGSTFKT